MTEKEDHLKSRYNDCVNCLLEISKEIKEKLDELDDKQKKWTGLEKIMTENAEKAKNKIKLDVGGKSFATVKDTLLKYENTYFHTMLSSGKWQPDDDGCYFIDRNPQYFDVILDYMRTGEISLEHWNAKDLAALQKELDYYQIPIPKETFSKPLIWWQESCGNNVAISQNGKVATKIAGGDGWNGMVLGTVANRSFRAKILRGNGNVMLGMAPKTARPNTQNPGAMGWFIYVYNGSLYSPIDTNRAYTAPVRSGSVIDLLYNPKTRQISFSIDGVSKGVAFTIPTITTGDVDLYPCVEFADVSSPVELVQSL